MSAGSPRSEVEMSTRFSILKEEGSGTVFISASSAQSSSGVTSIGLAPDAIIGGVYKIIRLLGFGAMGEVYLAKHLTLNKNCALKVIPPDQVTEVGWQRFQLEAKTVAKLNHVNIVRVTDLGVHEGCLPFYAMEYLEGQNLAEVLAESGAMPLDRALEIFMQVCDGLDCAHRNGMMHRDLKPANIMLIQALSGRVEVKILDFGLAKLTKHDRSKQSLTAIGDVFGSPSYMSPEQCGGEELDSRSDIYSIGCTFFECLTGRPPFASHVPGAVFFGHLETTPPTLEHSAGSGKFPEALEAAVAKLLRKDRYERYQTMAELKADLEMIAAEKNRPPVVEDKKAAQTNRVKKSRLKESRVKQSGSKDLSSKPYSPTHYNRGPSRQNRPKKALLLGMGLLVFCGVGSCVYYQFFSGKADKVEASQNQLTSVNKVSPNVAPSAARSSGPSVINGNAATTTAPIAEVDDKWDGTPFYKGMVQKGGKQFQHWSYESEHAPLVSLGFEGSRGPQRTPLIGNLYLPATAKISMFFAQDPILPSNRLKALTGANLDEVIFGHYSLKEIEMMMPTLTKCTSIESVRLGDSDWSVADSRASVDVINQFPNLSRLSLSAKCEGTTLARISRLNQLQELKLNRSQPYLHDCLKVVSGSKNLAFLGASNWGLPPSDLELLETCPNLEKVMIGRLFGSHEQILILAKLPHLQQLDMSALRYRSDLTADLSRLKSLKTLRFLITTEWTNAAIAQLRHDLPQVHLDMYATLPGSSKRSGSRKAARQQGLARPDQPGVTTSHDQSGTLKPGDESGAPKPTDQPLVD
jgi:serine/threonine-protein kinase